MANILKLFSDYKWVFKAYAYLLGLFMLDAIVCLYAKSWHYLLGLAITLFFMFSVILFKILFNWVDFKRMKSKIPKRKHKKKITQHKQVKLEEEKFSLNKYEHLFVYNYLVFIVAIVGLSLVFYHTLLIVIFCLFLLAFILTIVLRKFRML